MESQVPEGVGSQSRWSKSRLLTLGVGVLLLAAFATAGYFYYQLHRVEQQVEEAKQTALESGGPVDEQTLEEIQAAEKRIGEIVLLPAGETPTLVRIKDVEEIQENKEFLKDAQNGDEVLVYAQAKKAFLYRPSEHRLINLASVNIEPANTQTGLPQPTVAGTADLEDTLPLPNENEGSKSQIQRPAE